MILQLRHRIILVWLGTIALAMTLAAVLFMVLLLDFHETSARARLSAGFAQINSRLEQIGTDLRENGRRFGERQEVVSTLSMIDRYQVPAAYQPLVFDPEKKRLAEELAQLAQASGISRAVLYSRTTAVAGFEGGRSGFISYEGAGEAVFWRGVPGGGQFVRETTLPPFLRGAPSGFESGGEVVGFRRNESGAPALESILPLVRRRPGEEAERVGYLVLSYFLDKGFAEGVARSTGMELLLCGERMSPVGETTLPCPRTGETASDLFRLAAGVAEPQWGSTSVHNVGAARLPVAGGDDVHVVVGLDRALLTAQLGALRIGLLVGLVAATVLVLGVGFIYLRATLWRPLARLLEGIEAVSHGRFVNVEGGEQEDELGAVAKAFNQMASRLEEQQTSLRNLNADLEQRVELRTAELQRARDAAESANRAKSLFLANMSHELRTPLNAILGFAQLLGRDENLTAKQRQDLATIDRSGQHLLGLINDVLEISRIESGRVALEVQPFGLRSMLGSVEEMMRLRAEKQGLLLNSELSDGLPAYVQGDEHRLRQILLNLLGNAVKYTEAGWVAIRVRGDGEMEHGIRFEVEDSGPGIRKEDQARIFDAFFQTAEGAAKGEGTGLGLAICREYVALMGGTLSVRSEPGRGSLFYFTIPLVPVESPVSEALEARVVVGVEPGQPEFRNLIVEDNPDNRALLRRILEGAGLAVREAVDGHEALAVFEEWQPQIIWMDMRMPVMDGYEATRRIKAHPAGAQTVVLALTASAFEEDRSEVMAAGCDDFLRKPIRQELIYAALQRHLGLRFRYRQQESKAAITEVDLQPAMRRLPESLRRALGAQALRLDAEATAASIGAVRDLEPGLAAALQALLSDYRFDAILRLVEAASDPEWKEALS